MPSTRLVLRERERSFSDSSNNQPKEGNKNRKKMKVGGTVMETSPIITITEPDTVLWPGRRRWDLAHRLSTWGWQLAKPKQVLEKIRKDTDLGTFTAKVVWARPTPKWVFLFRLGQSPDRKAFSPVLEASVGMMEGVITPDKRVFVGVRDPDALTEIYEFMEASCRIRPSLIYLRERPPSSQARSSSSVCCLLYSVQCFKCM